MRVLWLDRERWATAIKPVDSLLTVTLIDPLVRLIFPIVLLTKVSPNEVTLIRLGVALASGVAFLLNAGAWAALAFVVWYVLDCIDGKLARTMRVASPFGDWLDRTTDRLGIAFVLVCEGYYFVSIGMPMGAVWCSGILGAWLYGLSDWLMLEQLDNRIKQVGSGATATGVASSGHTDPLPPLPGWFARLRGTLRRVRLTESIICQIEWLMLGICVAPMLRRPVLLVISCLGSFTWVVVFNGVFWIRRWQRIMALGQETVQRPV